MIFTKNSTWATTTHWKALNATLASSLKKQRKRGVKTNLLWNTWTIWWTQQLCTYVESRPTSSASGESTMSQGYSRTKAIHESKVGTSQPGPDGITITLKTTKLLQAWPPRKGRWQKNSRRTVRKLTLKAWAYLNKSALSGLLQKKRWFWQKWALRKSQNAQGNAVLCRLIQMESWWWN